MIKFCPLLLRIHCIKLNSSSFIVCPPLRPLSSRQDYNAFIYEYLGQPLSLTPNPQSYEKIWADFWKVNNSNLTRLNEGSSENESYSLLFPPPNITGQLHLGHSLTLALQDAFIRHQRMFTAADITFIPGFDHAGISTYLLLDKTARKLLNKSVKDLTQEEFTVIFEGWKNDKIKGIKQQLDRLGSSLDYSKEYFTLDADLSNSVNHAFSTLHGKGLIYRSSLPVNWSYFLQSALSDLEVNFRSVDGGTKLIVPGYPDKVDFGLFHTVGYPVIDGHPGELIYISTMNIYTLPGDVAIAVHPEDSRYTKYHNKRVLNPITEQAIPVIVDRHARIDFGTGAVKITPSSSYTDYEIALRHNLPIENFLNPDGTLMENSAPRHLANLYKCSHRYDLGKEIIEILKCKNLYLGHEKQATIVPFCKRSDDIIEHRVMPQWFLDAKPGYEILRNRIEQGEFQVFPPRKVNLLLEWFDKKRDWCLSRQIPFGHRVPAWRVPTLDEDTWFIAPNERRALKKATDHFKSKEIALVQDNDVLDTWFSSALLPLSALGWPNENAPFLKKFYPLTLMETGFDIITFWVMRMALLSLYLVDKLPFPKVHLHGMVCDGKGRKMSKSKGNIINPIDVIDGTSLEALKLGSCELLNQGIINQEEYENALLTQEHLFPQGIAPCGADGLRLSLYEYKSTAEKISFGVTYLENNRHMVNKIWQAFRFYLIHLEDVPKESLITIKKEADLVNHLDKMNKIDKWILGQFHLLIKDFHSNIENFNHNKIYHDFNNFWTKSLCDIYIEIVKPRENHPEFNPTSYAILGQLIESTLITMHPLIPFVTEELYQRLKRHNLPRQSKADDLSSILNEKFPNAEIYSHFADPLVAQEMNVFREIGRIIGSYKSTCKLSTDELKTFPITICSTELRDDQLLINALKRTRNVSNINLINVLDQQLIESSIALRASSNSIVLLPFESARAKQLLQFVEKKINRLQLIVQRDRNIERREATDEYLKRIIIDRDQLIRLLDRRESIN